MGNIVFCICIAVSLIVSILTVSGVMFYQYKQLKLCRDVQDKLISTFELMESAHEVTLQALQSTESFLKFLSETSQSHEEIQDRLYSKVNRLEEDTRNIHSMIEEMSSQVKSSKKFVG